MAKISTARSDKVKVDQKDLFISYTASDQNWAVWIAEEVERVGYSTVIQAWDFQVCQNFIHNMHLAIINARATAVIMSKSYFKSQFATDEWTAALAKRVLIPIRIEKMTPPGLFAPISYIDLAGLAQDAASAVLLKGVRSAFAGLDKRRTKPVSAGGSPGTVGASAVVSEYPGSLPLVWNVPRRRNRQFAGREDALHRLEATLGIGKLSVVAITGLDGTGKTELAAEYAYRHRSQYDTVWWVRAEGADTLIEDYCSLGRTRRLKIDPKQARAKTAGKVRDWLERNTRWLVIFDDAEMEGVEPYLPSIGDGAVIITTRQPTWGKLVH